MLERVERICTAAGTSLDNLVAAHLYLPDLRLLAGAVPAWEGAMRGHRPAGSALGVGPLTVPGCLVMLDAVAHVP